MTHSANASEEQVGKAYRKRKVKRRIFELLGNYRYSMPALNGLDRKLERFIVAHLDGKPGFFIEAGANDGYTQSNTFYFARKYGWRGILIEPIPELAAHCELIRPESAVVRCALGSASAQGESVMLHRAGLMSTVQGAIGDEDSQRDHLERASRLQPGVATGAIEASIRALSSVIDEHCPSGSVDFLSLDVEGYEPQVLSGIDFSRHRPRFICVESRNNDAISQALDEHYRLIDQLSHHDLLYEAKGCME